ncbi:hypothetical protein [Terrisporobacter vanillatitrophus]
MEKKFIIIFLLLNILLSCSCEMNNLNNSKNQTKLTTSDIKQLIGVTYGDVEKIYGSPEKSTYYINIKDLSSINNNYISLRDFNHYAIIKAYYDINDDDSYIILWYKDNKVVKSSFNETDVIEEDYFERSMHNMDIKIDHNKNFSLLNKNFITDNYRNYIGNNIKEFNTKYNLICPKIAVNLLNKNKALYFYDIKSNGHLNKYSLLIICDNNIIDEISIIDSSNLCETIIDYIK